MNVFCNRQPAKQSHNLSFIAALKGCFKLFLRLFFIFSFSVTFKRSLCFSCMVWVASERSQLFFREIIDVVVVVVRSVVASEGGELVVEGEPGAVG